jgi:hypothetical protein
MNQGPRWVLLMKKTETKKSRATVPLKVNLPLMNIYVEEKYRKAEQQR